MSVAVDKRGQHRAQGLGRHIARADDAEQALALPHIKHHRRDAPEFKVREQINDPVARHNGHRRCHRMAHHYQYAQHAHQGHHGQQHAHGQFFQQVVMLEMGVGLAHGHHGQRPREVAQRQAVLGVVLEQQHVGRHVHQHRADAEQEIVQQKQPHGAGFAGFDAEEALQRGSRNHGGRGRRHRARLRPKIHGAACSADF